nr:MAG TPA: hypothetical protein [Caudoviricetes sp.]
MQNPVTPGRVRTNNYFRCKHLLYTCIQMNYDSRT